MRFKEAAVPREEYFSRLPLDALMCQSEYESFVGRYFTILRVDQVCLNSGIWREFSNHNVIFPRFGCLHSKKRLYLWNRTVFVHGAVLFMKVGL